MQISLGFYYCSPSFYRYLTYACPQDPTPHLIEYLLADCLTVVEASFKNMFHIYCAKTNPACFVPNGTFQSWDLSSPHFSGCPNLGSSGSSRYLHRRTCLFLRFERRKAYSGMRGHGTPYSIEKPNRRHFSYYQDRTRGNLIYVNSPSVAYVRKIRGRKLQAPGYRWANSFDAGFGKIEGNIDVAPSNI